MVRLIRSGVALCPGQTSSVGAAPGSAPSARSAPGCALDIPSVGSPRTERPGLTRKHTVNSSVGLKACVNDMQPNQPCREGHMLLDGESPHADSRSCLPGTRGCETHTPRDQLSPRGLGVLGPASVSASSLDIVYGGPRHAEPRRGSMTCCV